MVLPDLDQLDTRPIAVLGAGTLGRRIALMYATRGAEIRLYDTSGDAAQVGAVWSMAALPDVVATVDGGRAGQILPVTVLAEAVRGAWLVTEAVPEHLDLKKSLFAELDLLAEPDTLLASNSSSFSSSHFVDHLHHPERVLNTHFLMPPGLRPVEIMSCGKTKNEARDHLLLRAHATALGLSPYVVRKQSMGFIYNRIWAAVKREAIAVIADGVADPATVDAIYTEATGQRHGPFRLMDKVGLDVVLDIECHYAEQHPGLPGNVRELLETYVAEGRLGSKAGRGFYDDYANVRKF